MILVTNTYSEVLEELRLLPASLIVETVLRKGIVLSSTDSLYGEVVNVIYVYSDFNAVNELKLKQWKGKIIFVCAVEVMYAFARHLKQSGLEVLTETLTEGRVTLVIANKYNCQLSTAKIIGEYFKFNLNLVIRCEDEIWKFIYYGTPLNIRFNEISISYAEVFRFLCGDPKIERCVFLKAVEKYKYSGVHMIEFIREILEIYIKLYFNEATKDDLKNSQAIKLCVQISSYLSIDRAMYLYYGLDGCSCYDLLKVV